MSEYTITLSEDDVLKVLDCLLDKRIKYAKKAGDPLSLYLPDVYIKISAGFERVEKDIVKQLKMQGLDLESNDE